MLLCEYPLLNPSPNRFIFNIQYSRCENYCVIHSDVSRHCIRFSNLFFIFHRNYSLLSILLTSYWTFCPTFFSTVLNLLMNVNCFSGCTWQLQDDVFCLSNRLCYGIFDFDCHEMSPQNYIDSREIVLAECGFDVQAAASAKWAFNAKWIFTFYNVIAFDIFLLDLPPPNFLSNYRISVCQL